MRYLEEKSAFNSLNLFLGGKKAIEQKIFTISRTKCINTRCIGVNYYAICRQILNFVCKKCRGSCRSLLYHRTTKFAFNAHWSIKKSISSGIKDRRVKAMSARLDNELPLISTIFFQALLTEGLWFLSSWQIICSKKNSCKKVTPNSLHFFSNFFNCLKQKIFSTKNLKKFIFYQKITPNLL